MRAIKKGHRTILGLLVALAVAGVTAQSSAQGVAYYSMQNTNWPPLPTNMFPALAVYDLGGG